MDIFAITPASSKPLWILAAICLLLLIVLAVLAFTAYSSRNSHIEMGSDRITLVGDFWGRAIPLRRLDVSNARIWDLTRESEFSPKRRTFGTGVPGYASGGFPLRGGEKALVNLAKRSEVVFVPTNDGYSLLLSVEEPAKFIEALQQHTR